MPPLPGDRPLPAAPPEAEADMLPEADADARSLRGTGFVPSVARFEVLEGGGLDVPSSLGEPARSSAVVENARQRTRVVTAEGVRVRMVAAFHGG